MRSLPYSHWDQGSVSGCTQSREPSYTVRYRYTTSFFLVAWLHPNACHRSFTVSTCLIVGSATMVPSSCSAAFAISILALFAASVLKLIRTDKAFTHGFISKWTHFARTIPTLCKFVQSLEEIIVEWFIPSLSGQSTRKTRLFIK